MVTLLLDSTRLEVVLSGTERVLSFHKGNVEIDRTSIAKVQLTDDPWTWLRGVANPGTHVRGLIAMGTWKSAGADDFAVIRRRRPGVVIDLEDHGQFQRVILTTRHGLALVQALQLDVDEKPADVAELATGAIPTPPVPPKRRKPKVAPAT
ncbi:hypothetical protein [Microbacterium ulmi]|uniref:Uncharacterized protein n=1 Tax=Microbacterium ulmi TaxID=179095 RepID=A0A7Y2M2B8_9MICO|nr:hypothetical protein [Microbacterium ulmi]NII69137.1 hypothetical protein [Microbacterium ulmi]NNH05144.1 hypothetical protein [Microbacterium ulmi]